MPQRAEIEAVFRTPFNKHRAGTEGVTAAQAKRQQCEELGREGPHETVRGDYFNKQTDRT